MSILKLEWLAALKCCNVPSTDESQAALAFLETSYSQPHRHYHNLAHVEGMLFEFWEICSLDVFPPFFPADDIPSVRFAIFYHDVIYDPASTENEIKSAEVARRSFQELGVPDEISRRVIDLILMTRNHQAPDADAGACLFLDLDLGVLGHSPENYDAYARAIRAEYSFVPETEYCCGRKTVLRDFLQRRSIFRSPYFKHLEKQARNNLAAEIVQIDEKLRTHTP